MNTLKKLFLPMVLIASQAAYGISLVGYDLSDLKPFRAESELAVAEVEAAMEPTRTIYASGKDYLKEVYKRTKEQLKGIYQRLKREYKEAEASGDATWYKRKQRYKAYKKYLYENWKKTRLFPTL